MGTRVITLNKISLLLICVVSAGLIVECGAIKLNSKFRDREIAVDGSDAEWKNSTTFLEKNNIAVGLFNDDDFLYLCLIFWNRRVQSQIMSKGLTVWFDSNGGHEKTFGIHFPLETKDMDISLIRNAYKSEIEESLIKFGELQTELEILGAGSGDINLVTPMSLTDAGIKGIEVKVGNSNGRLLYELKVPLRQNEKRPFAVGADKGKSLNIGFETPEVDMRSMVDERDIGIMTSPKRRMPSGGEGLPEQLEMWAPVQLALPPSGK